LSMRSGQGSAASLEVEIRREIDRYNARLRHCTGVAAGTLEQAMALLEEIWKDCQDPRTPEEIIDGEALDPGDLPVGGWPDLREKLYLLGYQLDYVKRLCQGALEPADGARETDDESEVF
jgi:hypothetical protein